MNIVIAGDGEVGFHLAKSLSELNHNIIVVHPHSALLQKLVNESEIGAVNGDSTSFEVLHRAEVHNCDLLLAVLHDESINIITCILGKKMGAKRTVARVSNVEYLQTNNKMMFRSLGVDEMVCPERIATKEIINLLNHSIATEFFDFSNGLLSMYLIRLDENASVINKTMREIVLEYPEIEVRIVAILRNNETIIPNSTVTFKKGDLAYIISKPRQLEPIKKVIGSADVDIKNVMIAGGGRIGRFTALDLENKKRVTLVDENPKRCETLCEVLNNTLVINGDATDVDLLKDEGIDRMDAFVAVTNSTETNILTCLHARKYGVKKTIALVENTDFINLSQAIGIDTIINKKLITASYIARFTVKGDAVSSKWLSGTNAELIELTAHEKSKATKVPIKDLNIPQGATIGGIIRGNQAILPTRETQIMAGDKVVVFTLPKVMYAISKLFDK
ncbi:MAG: Trk system potassium transporter TrkA [Bacteroidales bacterium]|nr:Trk system potassium transporter TrkA [Bacteroidales bacterium]